MDGVLSAGTILALYERGVAAGPAARTALLFAASGGTTPVETVPLGDIDRQIQSLHPSLHDGPVAATATCRACGTALEFALPPEFERPAKTGNDPVQVAHHGQTYAVRMPRLSDLGPQGIDLAALAPDAPWSDPDFVVAAETSLEQSDPGLRVTIGLTCHDCGSVQTQVLDISGFIWALIEQAARRLIRDIATLARTFGWSEAEIITMSTRRRALYLAEVAR